MNNHAIIHILDEVNVHIKGLTPADYEALSNLFAVFAKGYRFQARYKLGIWDGKIRFFNKNGVTYVKLLPEVIRYLRVNDYTIELQDDRSDYDVTLPEIDKNFLNKKGCVDEDGVPIILGEHQVRGVNALTEKHGIFEGGTGSGKAQPLYSKVMTPTGWTTMGELNVGDMVTDPVSGLPINVTGVFPQGEKEIYELTFKDGSKARACAEHLWKVKAPRILTKPERVEKVVNTLELQKILQQKADYKYSSRNVTIQLSTPVELSEQRLTVDPYILGLLIGDGGLTKSIVFSSADDFLIEEMGKYVETFDNLKMVYKSQYDYAISKEHHVRSKIHKNELLVMIQELGLFGKKSGDKFIPKEYKSGSIAQRFAILQGLMDSDGTAIGGASYSTTSEQLAFDVQEICWSLGMVCSKNIKRGRYKGNVHLSYRLNIGCVTPKELFRLPRKRDLCKEFWGNGINDSLSRTLVSVEYVGCEEAQCIMVDSPEHLYITDDYTVTHNTLMTAVLCLLYEENLKYKCIIIVPTSDLIGQTHEELIRFGVDIGQYSGDLKDINHQHLVSTWQSLQNNKGLIGQYHVVIVDECHGVTGDVLREILNEHGANCRVKVGLTGTMPEEPIDLMAVNITLGEVVESVEASELIASGWLAKLYLRTYRLVEDVREEYHRFCELNPDKAGDLTYTKFKNEMHTDYVAEKRYIQSKVERLQFLARMIETPDNHSLVLVPNVEFGRKISKLIPGAIFFYGKDSRKIRKEIYKSFQGDERVIAITTYKLASTGLNIKRIFNLFLIDAGKSFVEVIQSIGRGLRKGKGKNSVRVYDIHSDFKFSKRHAATRKKHYKKKNYPYKEDSIEYLQLVA